MLGVGIGSALLARDHYVLLVDAASDPERQLLLADQLRDQRVDGLIVQPLDPSDERWSQLAESLPIVSIGDALHGGQAAGEVVFDNRSGVTLALEHLHKLGHRRIGVLSPTQPSTPDRPADIHVIAEAERLGLDVSITSHRRRSRQQPRWRMGAVEDRPANGTVLLRGLHRLRRLRGCSRTRIAHPDEVSISGYDNHPMSALLTPALTTMDWNTRPNRPRRRPAHPRGYRAKALPPPHCPAAAPA